MIGYFYHFHQCMVFRPARNTQTGILQLFNVVIVDLVAVAMTLYHRFRTVEFTGTRTLRQQAGLPAQTHGATEI